MTVFIIFFSIVLIPNSLKGIANPIGPGIVVNYSVFLNRELANGDVVGITGEVQILFKNKPNSTHIIGDLNAIIDLAWIEGRPLGKSWMSFVTHCLLVTLLQIILFYYLLLLGFTRWQDHLTLLLENLRYSDLEPWPNSYLIAERLF